MKTIIPFVVLIGLLGALVYSYMSEPTTYTAPAVEEVEQEEVETITDPLDALQEELNRVNQELDAEESRLLDEKARLKAEYEAKDAELESRLERIRETRVSFQ